MSESVLNETFQCLPIVSRQCNSCSDGCDKSGIGANDHDPYDNNCCNDCALCCCFCGLVTDLFSCPCRYFSFKNKNANSAVVEI